MNTSSWQIPTFKVFYFKKRSTKYCICIPVFNEGNKFIHQLKRMLPYAKIADIIVADWGSTDGSTKIDLLKKYKVKSLLVLKGPGRQSAQLRIAYAYAIKQGYKGIINMDGNNKDGVENIPEFIKALDEGYDVIQGSRFKEGGKAINTPVLRWLGIRLFFSPLISLVSGFLFTDITNGFRAYSSSYLLNRKVKPFRKIFERYELLFYLPFRAAQLKVRLKEIPVIRVYPKGEIPTKIIGVGKHFNFLITGIKTAFGLYNPN